MEIKQYDYEWGYEYGISPQQMELIDVSFERMRMEKVCVYFRNLGLSYGEELIEGDVYFNVTTTSTKLHVYNGDELRFKTGVSPFTNSNEESEFIEKLNYEVVQLLMCARHAHEL